MAIFQKLRHYLGFDEENDEIYADSDEENASETGGALTKTTGNHEMTESHNDENLTADIFTAVVNLINESLPPFLKENLDVEAQKQYIYNSLDSSLKQRLSMAENDAARRAEARYSSEHSSLLSEIESLKNKNREFEQKSAGIRQQQLSADRQKRALSDRVHDLESQIASLEAEREQYDLENKSLLNKIKVAGVVEGDSERLKAEIENLRRQLKDTASASGDAGNESLASENAALKEALDILKAKQDMADAMVDDMRKKAATLREELEAKEKTLEEVSKKAEEADKLRDEFAAVEQQMSLIEEVIAKRDKKIEAQKLAIASLEEEAASLRDTIVRNLAIQAENEETMRRRIAALEASPKTPVVISDLDDSTNKAADNLKDEVVSPKISDTDLIEIEESFSLGPVIETTDTTRVVATRTARESDGEEHRGQRRRRHDNDNDAQMSLF